MLRYASAWSVESDVLLDDGDLTVRVDNHVAAVIGVTNFNGDAFFGLVVSLWHGSPPVYLVA